MIIYKATNLINGKIYIGQTSRTLNQRMSEHLANNRTSYFDRALKKYGIHNFKIEVIADAKTKQELDEKEKYFIKYYKCKIPSGYNMTDGGEGQLGVRKYGCENAHYGKKHTEATKEKMRNARKKYIKEKHPMAKAIINLDTGEVFQYMKSACDLYGLDRSTLTKACKGKRKTCGGFHWSYAS